MLHDKHKESDEREIMMKEIERRDILLHAVNSVASMLLMEEGSETFLASLQKSMEIIGRSVDVDCVEIWKNEMVDGELIAVCKHYWTEENITTPAASATSFPYSATQNWEERLSQGEYIQGTLLNLPPKDRDFLSSYGCKSVLVIPIFVENRLWGICCIDDYSKYRGFSEDEINILRSCGLLFANAMIHNDMVVKLYETSDHLELQLAKMRMVVQATKIGLWEMEVVNDDFTNPANEFIWSDELRHMLGFNDESDFPNVLGSWSMLLHPEDRYETLAHAVSHLQDKTGKTPYEKEYRLMKKNGEYGYFRAYGGSFRDEQGNATRITGALMDITETKNTIINNELQLTKLGLVVKGAKIGLWDMEIVQSDPVNPDNIFNWSDELRHMLGFSDENDFPNVLSSWSSRLHPNEIDNVIDVFKRHLMDTSGSTPYDVEYRMRKKNDEYSYFRASGETIRDENGNALRVAGALMDISEAKRMTEALNEALDQAKLGSKAKSDFLSMMSHEIRTPMNAILGITEIQLQNEALDEDIREAFEKIYVSGDILLGIINDILDLSKIEAGKMELYNEKYEIASLINDAVQLNLMRIGTKPIEFELYADENLPLALSGDELRIKQILNNLLSNAFKYTEEGTVKLSAHAEPSITAAGTTASNDTDSNVIIVFRVSDTGQGMTPEQLEQLYEEYARFDMGANRVTEGTGLGMSIVKKLLHLMNGEIYIDSKYGEGSTFTIRLPQLRSGQELLGKTLADNLMKYRLSSKANMKRTQISREPMPYGSVLIVDDVEANIYVARGLLTSYELKIDSVYSGNAAIEKIDGGNIYDIIFMDHMMPGMDGIETTKILRDLGYEGVIVALTANAATGQADMFLEKGFDDFIAKPIDVRQLNAVLNKFIRDKQSAEVLEAARLKAQTKKEKTIISRQTSLIDPRLAEIFVREASVTLHALDSIIKKYSTQDHAFTDEDNKKYISQMHGIKIPLANINEPGLSALAGKLERAGQDNDTLLLSSKTTVFLNELRDVIEKLKPQDVPVADIVDVDFSYLCEKLIIIKQALGNFDQKIAKNTIIELREKAWPHKINEQLGSMAEYLLNGDYDEVSLKADEIIKSQAC